MQPVMSILVCVGPGSAPFLKAAVESVVGAEGWGDGPAEVVLAVNKTTDGAARKIVEAIADFPCVVVTEGNGTGYADAMNAAWNIATGKYIARQDADDLTHPWRFAHSHFVVSKTKADVVTCSMVRFESGNPDYDEAPQGRRMDWEKFWTGRDHGPPAVTVVCHRKIYEAAMPLSEKYSITADSEWIAKVYEAGFTNWEHIGAPMYAYRQHPGHMTKRNKGAHALYQRLVQERIPECFTVKA